MGWIDRRGFEFEETMEGTYARIEAPDQRWPLRFVARVRVPSMLRYLRTGLAEMAGTLDAERLATAADFTGTMLLQPLSERRIGYQLRFTADSGETHLLRGEKHIRPEALLRTLTELDAEILDASGALVARAHVRFDLPAQTWCFLRSWRLT
jgi:hypothetical protein